MTRKLLAQTIGAVALMLLAALWGIALGSEHPSRHAHVLAGLFWASFTLFFVAAVVRARAR